ncbi:transcriptional regulator with XRE-family HTH domain [Brevirhabdus pacifica]|nr:transcriptional regulator with XRE-family HTH domain [Brevirhabdus pacifica]
MSSGQQGRWYATRDMSIAENLRRLRKASGMSQKTLAEKAGVGQQLISQLERGENTSSKKLPKIAEGLGCAVHDLDPAYRPNVPGGGDEVREKFTQIVESNDVNQLRLLDDYLDFLLSRQRGSTQ